MSISVLLYTPFKVSVSKTKTLNHLKLKRAEKQS